MGKRPKKQVETLLKIGVYALLYIDNIPDYAIVSECVEAARSIGKEGACGFINAVLKRVARREYVLPAPSDENYLSVHYSVPEWFARRLVEEYGRQRAESVLEDKGTECVHLRVNTRISSNDAVKKLLDAHAQEYVLSAAGGLLTRVTPLVRSLFAEGVVTYQSPSSMLAVQGLAPGGRTEILDLCSAPGGKAVYASELAPAAIVTACDVHPHRIELIKKYASRMHADNVRPVLSDATVFEPRFEERFDFVMADVPCTCFGTYKKHPDVFLQRGEEAIAKLAATQKRILDNAVRYLKKGGVLVYSTCTFAPEENEGVIADFIRSHPDFSILPVDAPWFSPGRPDWVPQPVPGLEHTLRLWPHLLRGEGHFAAVLVRQGDEAEAYCPTEPALPKPVELTRFCQEAGVSLPEGSLLAFGRSLWLAPTQLPALKGLKVVRPGLELGQLLKNRFEPAHALALWLRQSGSMADFSWDSPEIAAYLSGGTIQGPQTGWTLIQVDGLSLGWAKGSGGTLKNHFPTGLRRMG